MSKRAWMPLYVGDYLGDTGHLSTVQHGAYLLLMMHYWRKGELPDEDVQLAAITKLPVRIWAEIRPTIQAFFYDGWRHKRIDEELLRMQEKTARRAAAGQKGGLRAAMNRMVLEDVAIRTGNAEAIRSKATAKLRNQQSCSNATGTLDHSHSHRNITSTENEDGGTKQLRISPELERKLKRA